MSARILIIDDEPHIRTVMRLALEGRGYEVGEAASGEEGLDRLDEGPRWDLVLLDERMPGIDGLETLRRLRQRDPDAIVIMVTAFASIELAVEAMKLGATDFVRKPMTPDTLRAAVDGALVKARGEWPPARTPAAATAERAYEIWMLNGFSVRHIGSGSVVTEQRFDVRRSDSEAAARVTVQFEPAVSAAAAEQGAGRSTTIRPSGCDTRRPRSPSTSGAMPLRHQTAVSLSPLHRAICSTPLGARVAEASCDSWDGQPTWIFRLLAGSCKFDQLWRATI